MFKAMSQRLSDKFQAFAELECKDSSPFAVKLIDMPLANTDGHARWIEWLQKN